MDGAYKTTQDYNEGMSRLVDHLPLHNPWAVTLDPSNLCNFRCQFCPNMDQRNIALRPNGLMSLELFQKIVEDITNAGWRLKALKLWKDGEPLLNRHLPEFISIAKRSNAFKEIRLTTNGSLLDRMAEKLVDAELDWIMISYLSPKKEDYASHAGDADLRDVVIRNVERLRVIRDRQKAAKPFISVKMCSFPFISAKDIDDFHRQFKGLGDEIVIQRDPINWDNSSGRDLTLGAGLEGQQQRKVCPYAWYQLNINFNGKVSVCPVDWAFKTIIGDVTTESLAEIWAGEKMKSFRGMFTRQDFQLHPGCGQCTYYHFHQDNIDDYVLSAGDKRQKEEVFFGKT